ncbi:hypothetical protein [Kitasatospora nipponensis]|uniref:hypothetical protein n=1 Tax=Kitasatospora nipponensis TaxID=258049 RepID=UPI0031D9760E
MSSSTPDPTRVPMSRLLAASAAAAALCTPPCAPGRRGEAGREERGGDQATTVTRVPVGAKSQSV